MKEESIDKILRSYLKSKSEEEQPSEAFNDNVMQQITAFPEPAFQASLFSSGSILRISILLAFIAIGSCLYLLDMSKWSLYESFTNSFDLGVFQQKGVKYMVYALAGLLVFSVIDRLIQLKSNMASK